MKRSLAQFEILFLKFFFGLFAAALVIKGFPHVYVGSDASKPILPNPREILAIAGVAVLAAWLHVRKAGQ